LARRGRHVINQPGTTIVVAMHDEGWRQPSGCPPRDLRRAPGLISAVEHAMGAALRAEVFDPLSNNLRATRLANGLPT
jgi:hypothetical protein